MLEPKTTPGQSDLMLAASIVRLFAASRPLVGSPDAIIRGRYEGEQAACSYLAELFEQMAADNKPVREMKTDLSLGGLDLGDPAGDIAEVETDAEKKAPKQEGSMLRHYYADMQIVEENGKITALVSETDKVSTKRGIHQGSTLDEVQKAYGTDTFSQSDDGDGRTLYEYKFTGQDDRVGLLRFAVKDGKVDYISVRTYEGAAQPAGVQAAAPAVNDSESAKGTLRNFYSAISSKNLAAAWNLMTPEQQSRMGGYDSFRNGYSTTLSSAATNITVASSSADKVVLMPPGHDDDDLVARLAARNPGGLPPLPQLVPKLLGVRLLPVLDRIVDDPQVVALAFDRATGWQKAVAHIVPADTPAQLPPSWLEGELR